MKILIAFYVIVLLFSSGLAQRADPMPTHPNLSGTWMLDKKSLPKRMRDQLSDYTLTIEHTGDLVKIDREYFDKGNKVKYTESLYTDKRKEENIDFSGVTFREGFGKVVITSKSYWKKRAIIREFIYSKSDIRVAYLMDRQRLELSADGNTLTITTEFQPNIQTTTTSGEAIPRPGDMSTVERKLVFVRKTGQSEP